MIRFTSWKFFSTAALSGLLLAAGCGDDDGDTPAADASTPDADDTDEPDTEPETPPHTGLVAIFETDVLPGPVGPDLGVGGAVVSVGWQDQATATVDPVPGFESNLTGCLITVYDVTAEETPAAPTDEGAVTIAGTAYGEFVCAFNEGTYGCQSTDEDANGEVPVGSTALAGDDAPTATYTIPGANFDDNFVGQTIMISGFPADSNANGAFPIVAVPAATTVVVVNPLLADDAEVADAAGTYSAFIGAAPFPGGQAFDFLPAEVEVTVSKGESDFIPAFETTIIPNGEGFELDATEGILPNAVPYTGEAITFACPTDTGCGAAEGGDVQGMIISGSTTDADLTGLPFFAMPPAENAYATYQCSAIGSPRITIPAAGMEAILGTNPTRMQFNVAYVAGNLLGDTTVLSGHAITGFSDAPVE